MEILVATDHLDEVVHSARIVPLTDSVRVEAQTLRAATERLRRAASQTFGAPPAFAGPTAEVFELIAAVEALAAAARRVPLTKQVRVDREPLYELLDRLRAVLPDAIREQRVANGDIR
jgi:hypothetical protein